MANIQADFLDLMGGWDLEEIEGEQVTAYGLTTDLRLAWFSKGWKTFALQNHGSAMLEAYPIGTPLLRAIPDPLAQFYEEALLRVSRDRKPWDHHYECSSPIEYRTFLMRVYPLQKQNRRGLLVLNSLTLTKPIENDSQEGTLPEAFAGNGLLTQCSHCRRFRGQGKWVWAGMWLNDPPHPVSHSLCRTCLEYHYPEE